MRSNCKGVRIWAGLFVLCLLSVPFVSTHAAADGSSAPPGQFKIAATIFPLSDIAKQIAKGRAEVGTVLPAGANPHTFELSPRAVKELDGVLIVFAVGRGFDDWIKASVESLEGLKIFEANQGINLMRAEQEDPHYWLSIANAKMIARNITLALSRSDPAGSGIYQANLESYLEKLDQADHDIRMLLSNLSARKMITFHDGWRYFARDYGLEIVATVEPSAGSEPTPKHLARLARLVSEHGIQTLFSEPAVPKGVAESIARDLGLRLHQLDPLGGEGQSFLDLITANARVISEALSHG